MKGDKFDRDIREGEIGHRHDTENAVLGRSHLMVTERVVQRTLQFAESVPLSIR